MSNYFRSEIYRLIHNKWTYLFLGMCSMLLLASNIVLAAVKHTDSNFTYATTYFAFSFAYTSMQTVLLLCITVSFIVFDNEYKNSTMKNSITYGIQRGTIYFGKLFIQILYAIAAFVIIIGIHILSAYLMLENSGPNELEAYIRSCLACLPFFIFGLAAANTFAFLIEGTGGAVTASGTVIVAFPMVCNLLGKRFVIFNKLSELLPWNMIGSVKYDAVKKVLLMYWDTDPGFLNCWVSGIIQAVLIVGIGYVLFRRKEIK
ncbi:MAG: ABC transporter permease [Clostridiaceae bacterium]